MNELGPQIAVFRMSMSAIWPMSGFMMLALLPMSIRQIVTADDPSIWVAIAALSSLLLVPVLLAMALWPLIWLYSLRVHELGLRGFSAGGRFISARWPTLLDATPVSVAGMRYVRLRSTEAGVVLYLPLQLDDPAGFATVVRQYAGPSNPLTQFLERDEAEGADTAS